MSNFNNPHIQAINQFVCTNTPLDFVLNHTKYEEILYHTQNLNLNMKEKEIVVAAYALLYTALDYHFMIKDNRYSSYCILIGDYITSFISEILYTNNLYELLHIFITNTKQISINIIKKQKNDTLLNDIIEYYKGEQNEFI